MDDQPKNSSSSESFTSSGMHPEVRYTVRIDGVSVEDVVSEAVRHFSAFDQTPYCRICRFAEFASEDENIGRCRRNSPYPDNELGTAKWPIVAWNDWCGDWEHK